MEAKKAQIATDKKLPQIAWACKQVELHTPIRFRGQTHNNLYKDKHKGLITKMGYDSDFRVMIIDCETEHHILPAVAVADAIVDA